MDYIHIDGAVPADGSQIEFQSKTSKFAEISGTGACGVGCGNAFKSADVSLHASDGSVGFIPECCVEGIEGQRCRLEGADKTHCESLRLRFTCTGTSVCIGPTALSSATSIYPLS